MITTIVETSPLEERILKALVDSIPDLRPREYERAASAIAAVLKVDHQITANMRDYWKHRADGAE